jgi:hypothetical protein
VNHEDYVFGLAQTEARHEIVGGILSPEEWLLSRVPVVAAGRAAWRNNSNHCTLQKVLKGCEPGEDAASDPCEKS